MCRRVLGVVAGVLVVEDGSNCRACCVRKADCSAVKSGSVDRATWTRSGEQAECGCVSVVRGGGEQSVTY